MSIQNASSKDPGASTIGLGLSEVDQYGVPLTVFGNPMPPEFFDVVGRIVAINGKIEYLKDRLQHLPSTEIEAVKKVKQFTQRYNSGRAERNAIVHSSWVFGADTDDPDVIFGIRYKVGKLASRGTATVSIRDVPESERKQEAVRYRLSGLRKILKRDLVTMQVGEYAFTEVMLTWAARQVHVAGEA